MKNQRCNTSRRFPLTSLYSAKDIQSTQKCRRTVNHIKRNIKSEEGGGGTVCVGILGSNKVWHRGFMYKIKRKLPQHILLFFKSLLTLFQVQFEFSVHQQIYTNDIITTKNWSYIPETSPRSKTDPESPYKI